MPPIGSPPFDQPGRSLGLHAARRIWDAGGQQCGTAPPHFPPLAVVSADPMQFALAAGHVLSSISTTTRSAAVRRRRPAVDALVRRVPPGLRGGNALTGLGRDCDLSSRAAASVLQEAALPYGRKMALQFLDDLAQPARSRTARPAAAFSDSGSSGGLSLAGKADHIRAQPKTCTMP